MMTRAVLMHCTKVALLSALLLPAAQSVHAEWSVPDELQTQVSALNDEQTEFITSGAILDIIPERQLLHELAERDADSLGSLVDDLISVAKQMGYDPLRDMGAAPLNTTSKRFNRGTFATPEPLREHEREDEPEE